MQHFRTEINPVTGNQEDFYFDHEAGKLVQRTRHKVGEVLERNKRQANRTIDGRKFGGGEMLHEVANIPMGVVLKWKREHGVDVFNKEHKRKMLRLLDDPEYRYLKSTTAKLSR